MKYLKYFENNIDPFGEEDWDEKDNQLKNDKYYWKINLNKNTINISISNNETIKKLINMANLLIKTVKNDKATISIDKEGKVSWMPYTNSTYYDIWNYKYLGYFHEWINDYA